MDTKFKYYAVQILINEQQTTIYVAKSEKERWRVLSWMPYEDREFMRQVDVTRSKVLGTEQLGFQNLDYWMSRQNHVVNG